MLAFRHWLAEGISQISYLIGDDATHTAAVIDPRPDVDIYLDAARELGVAITHILETHIHADYMSGSRELASRLGSAEICASGEGDEEYGFAVHRLRDGDVLAFGSALLRARFTPGHTPEHLSYEACEKQEPERPWGVLSGDALFVGSAGRPDLLGDRQTPALMCQLFKTLREYYLKLPDDVIIYPCHGKGSACGPTIGARLSSTIGYERQHNRFLMEADFEKFREAMLSGSPRAPTHYPRLKKVNAAGPEILGCGPVVPALVPEVFQEQLARAGTDVQLVDSRDMLAFGGGHIPGAINLGADKAEMSVYAGWVLDPQKPILLVLEGDESLEHVVRLLVRTGFTKFAGYLTGGMAAWNNAGLPLQEVRQMHAREVASSDGSLQRLDVRQQSEFGRGHVPGAINCFVADLLHEQPDLDPDRAVVTYCGMGYRASLAASLLQRAGFDDVRSMPGSLKAWTTLGLPIQK